MTTGPSVTRRAAMLTAMTAALGACRAQFDFLQRASPNPMHHAQDFVVPGVTFDEFVVNEVPEASFVMTRAGLREEFEQYKSMLASALLRQLYGPHEAFEIAPQQGPAPLGTFVLRPRVRMVELRPIGYVRGRTLGGTPYGATLLLDVLQSSGALVDVVQLHAPAAPVNETVPRKMDFYGRRFGYEVIRFLLARVREA